MMERARIILAFTKQKAGFFKIEWRWEGDEEHINIERRRMSSPDNLFRRECLAQFGLDPNSFSEGKRVSRDPATGFVDMPRHFGELRGRPPKGERAMSDAERSRAYRDRKRKAGQ